MARLFVFWTLLLAALGQLNAKSTPITFCDQNLPLTTEHVALFYEESLPVRGCVSSQAQPGTGLQTVVVRTNTTSKDVLLTVTDNVESTSSGLVLILDSKEAVRWRLSFFGQDRPKFKRQVILSKGSTLAEANSKTTLLENDYVDMQLSTDMPDEKFATIVRQKLSALTIFTQIGKANRASVSLAHVASTSNINSSCDLSMSSSMSESAMAFLVNKQKMTGCYHAEMAGTLSSDVHVVDITSADRTRLNAAPIAADTTRSSRATTPGDHHFNNDKVEGNSPAIFLSMTPKQTSTGDVIDSAPRNITLILRSAFPVRWFLESWRLSGNLEVVSTNGPVENYSLASGQNLHVERRNLPSDFDQLWRTIALDTGLTPISYVKADVANVVSMVIPPRSKRGLDDMFSTDSRQTSRLVPDTLSLDDAPNRRHGGDVAKKVVLIPGNVVNEATLNSALGARARQLELDLKPLIKKNCNQQETVVTLPRKSLAKFNVSDMSLNEENCVATKNETHWILRTKSTSCGSLNVFSGNHPMLKNNILLSFHQESEFYGQEVRVPFSCKFPAGFLGFSPSSSDYDGSDSDDYDDDDEESGEEMYTMKIFRKRQRLRRPEILASHPGDSATVSVGDQLKVQTDFETRSFFSLMIEQCWVSNQVKDDDPPHLSEEDRWLIYEGCAVSDNVTLFPTPLGTNPAFAFTVTEAHRRMGKIYIYCRIGLCTPVEISSGNIVKCADTTVKCASNDWHIGPAAQQDSVRGPFFVRDRLLKVEFDTSDFSTAASSSSSSHEPLAANQGGGEILPDSPGIHSSHKVMVGVPAEIAVAIALASFVIGAALTGMLCCIHHRKAVPKSTQQNRRDDSNEGSELQSMIASPNVPASSTQPPKLSRLANA